ncbi:MAG: hypothetical protein ACQCN4_05285 [Candidatus Bathyarchaeia archaeon]|jgi:hypothetical protein
MLLAVVAGVLVGFLLYGLSYGISCLFVSDVSNQVPSPTPTSMLDELCGALLLVGLAAIIAFTIVIIGLIINRVRTKSFGMEASR